jgi:hypothetical protein
VFQFLGAGIEEERSTPDASRIAPGATVVRGVLNLQSAVCNPKCQMALFDLCGKLVMPLRPGHNDVRGLAPGIYFARGLPGNQARRLVVVE